MTSPTLSSETIHASCVSLGGRAVLICGPSGSGKSDLALRLIDRGAILVSDDYTIVQRRDGRLYAAPPPSIEGRMEIRGIGIVEMEHSRNVPICLAIDLARTPQRMPEASESYFAVGVGIPSVALGALEPSAPVKAELALLKLGLQLP